MARLTDRQKAMIKQLAAKGLSDDDIAELVPCSRGAVHYRRRSKHAPANLYTPAEDDILERIFLADPGQTIMDRVRQIAEALGRTTGSVHSRLNFLGLIKTGEHKPPQALKPWPTWAIFGPCESFPVPIPSQAIPNGAPVSGAGHGAATSPPPAAGGGSLSEVSA